MSRHIRFDAYGPIHDPMDTRFTNEEIIRVHREVQLDAVVAHRMTKQLPPHVVEKVVFQLAQEIAKRLLTTHKEALSLERGYDPEMDMDRYRVTAEVMLCVPKKL